MERQSQRKRSAIVMDTKEFILCPNCNCCFPQIQKLIIKNERFNVCVTCDHCNELHHGKVYDIETLLNGNPKENNHNKQNCGICGHKNEMSDALFCITCEKWVCNKCVKLHDEYATNDLHSYVGEHKRVHSFCDREIYFRHKCCVHHNIKPIDRTLETVLMKGLFKSVEAVETNVNDEVISQKSSYNKVLTNASPDVPGSERTNIGDNKDTVPKPNTGLLANPGNDALSTSDNNNSVLYDANYEGNVYADKYCLECNLFFCESCAIDHEDIMKHNFDKETAHDQVEHSDDVLNGIVEMKQQFILALSSELLNLKALSSNNSNPANTTSSLAKHELNILDTALELNQQHHGNYLRLFIKVANAYNIMKSHNIFNLSIINSYRKLIDTNNINTLLSEIQSAKKFFQTLNVFLLTKFCFKTERIGCFKDHSVHHNGVTSMIFFRDRLYTGGKRTFKKWKFPYTSHLSSTLLKTKDGSLTGRLTCFCKASDTLILAGSEKGNILLCEFGQNSGIRITATDRQQPILCMQLLADDSRDSNRVTSFLLSDTRGIWEITIESRNGRTLLSEVEFFKTRDEYGRNVPVSALITAKGAKSCFLLGGLDYIYPKFRGNTLIKIQDSIKCSERDENKLISCMTYVEGTSILVVGSYDRCVGALVLHNPQQKSKYKEIKQFNSGVVSVVSNKENEVIALSAEGMFTVINLTMCFEGTGFQWEVVASFQSDNFPTVSLVPLQAGYFAICGCDTIEIWYAHL